MSAPPELLKTIALLEEAQMDLYGFVWRDTPDGSRFFCRRANTLRKLTRKLRDAADRMVVEVINDE